MRLGRKLATGVVTEATEDVAQEQVVEPSSAAAEEAHLELADELANPLTAA